MSEDFEDIPDDQPIGEYLREKGYTREQAEQVVSLAILHALTFGDCEVSEEESDAFFEEELAALPK